MRERPCTIALDNYSVHHSALVQAAEPVLAKVGVTFFYLPPYSPELSTVEPVWRHTKYTDITTRSYADGAALQRAVNAALDKRAVNAALDKRAVNAALDKRAAMIQHTAQDLPRGA